MFRNECRADVRLSLGFGLGVWLWVMAGAAACSSGPTGPDIGRLPLITTGDPKAEADLDRARRARDGESPAAAEALYRTFLRDHPEDPLLPIAQLELGKLLLDRDAVAEADRLFGQVAQHPEASVAEQGRFYGAVTAHRQGRSGSAAVTLRPMVGRTIDPHDTTLLLTTLAEAELSEGDLVGAVTSLDRLATEPVPEADRAQAAAQVAELIAQRATAEEIAELLRELPQDGVGYAHALRRAIRDAQAAGDAEQTRELVERMRAAGIRLDSELEEIALRASQPGDADPRAVGAILSLTGRARRVGERALRGLMLAAGIPPDGPAGPEQNRIIFRDDGGDPAKAAAAVDELVSVHRVIAIVGPMGGEAARAAAERAKAAGLPMIALTPTSELVRPGEPVFQIMPTAEAEVTRLVDQAIAEGARRFAILRPEGSYGDTMNQVFEATVGGLGATVVGGQTYASNATSFGQEVAALTRARPDALFVADAAARLALIAPALAAAGLWSGGPDTPEPSEGRSVQLLAPSVAFDHTMASKGERYLQGALFAVPFDPVTADGPGRRFVEAYEAQFGRAPDTFAALAYDAFKLIETGTKAGAVSRAALADALRRVRSDALSGPSRGFAPDGSLETPTRLLRFEGEAFVPVTSRP